MSEDKVLVTTPTETTALATMSDPPAAVLKEAKEAAVALQGVIAQKPHKVMMGGEQYLEFEDWQTLGRFYGITAREDGDPEFVDLAGVKGFKASSVGLFAGKEISRATAYCLNDEEKWSSRPKYEYHMVLKDGSTAPEEKSQKNEWVWEPNPNKPGGKRPQRKKVLAGEEPVPLFQLASMAQTRANAKALRNVLSWVAVLAGYKPTPAEEMADAKVVDAEVVPEKPAQGEAPGSGCPFCGSAEFVVSEDKSSAICAQRGCQKGWNLGR